MGHGQMVNTTKGGDFHDHDGHHKNNILALILVEVKGSNGG